MLTENVCQNSKIHLKSTNQFIWTEVLSKGLTPLWIDDVRHFVNFFLTADSKLEWNEEKNVILFIIGVC